MELTHLQSFEQYLDERITKGNELWKANNTTSQMCDEWFSKTKGGVTVGIGKDETDNSFHHGNFYPPMFTEKELKRRLAACIDETKQIRKWTTSVLPNFDVRNLDKFR
ncbi:MAG TPA: hypothetical protein VIJ93_08015 [bacterium]